VADAVAQATGYRLPAADAGGRRSEPAGAGRAAARGRGARRRDAGRGHEHQPGAATGASGPRLAMVGNGRGIETQRTMDNTLRNVAQLSYFSGFHLPSASEMRQRSAEFNTATARAESSVAILGKGASVE
jgi:hypothetical protein